MEVFEKVKSKWISFFRSSLQRRMVLIIFFMAVVPIIVSSVVGNFWFQRALKKSTIQELKLSNELISERIENDLRYIQETMSLAFRFGNQNRYSSENNKEEDVNENILERLIGLFEANVQKEQNLAMRQDLLEIINDPNLFRSVHYIDKNGTHLGGHQTINSTNRESSRLVADPELVFSDDPDFQAFREYLMQQTGRSPRTEPGREQESQRKFFSFRDPTTFISDVVLARDNMGEIIQPVVPVINIWSVNRFALRPSRSGGFDDRVRPGESLYLRLELNAQDFFKRIESQSKKLETDSREFKLEYVGLPNGDYLLHPDADCILCSLSSPEQRSWKDDFPELVAQLSMSDNEVFFDKEHDRVVAAQRVYFDELDSQRNWILIRSIPMEQVLSAVNNLRRLTIILVLIMMLFVIPGTLWITRDFTKPIRALVAATEKIAEGDLETVIPVRADDELGQLADSYEKMKGRIRNMIQYLKDRQSEAESANKAKSTFLANMSHELRTPLNGILGYAQILKQSPDLTPKQTEGVNVILRSGEHLLSLINDILDLSKVEAGRMELHPVDFSLNDLLDNLSRVIDLRARQKKIKFRLEKGKGLPDLVHGDDSRLRQVLMNLLSNAVKFTDVGEVVLHAEVNDDKIKFVVKDTGPGISSEHIESIFSPFQQVGRVDRMTEGTGLGLAISRKLTQMLGGELRVKSKLGCGSHFYFNIKLPKVNQSDAQYANDTTIYWMGAGERDAGKVKAAKQAAQSHGIITGYQGARRKVLVVDDKIENRAILRELLVPLGFEVFESVDGQEAIEMTPEVKPDLILMDLRMPRVNGYNATRAIRKQQLDIEPVIITISASAFASNRNESLNAGANDFVPKPVRRSLLLETIHNHAGIDWIYDEKSVSEEEDTSSMEVSYSSNAGIEGKVCEECLKGIDMMIELARRGNLKGLESQLDELTESFPQVAPLDKSLRPLIKSFKLKEINQLLEKTREEVSVQPV